MDKLNKHLMDFYYINNEENILMRDIIRTARVRFNMKLNDYKDNKEINNDVNKLMSDIYMNKKHIARNMAKNVIENQPTNNETKLKSY